MSPVYEIVMLALADRYGWEDYDLEADPENLRPDAVRVVTALVDAGIIKDR